MRTVYRVCKTYAKGRKEDGEGAVEPHKWLVFAIYEALFTIQTLPEFIIGNSQMLIFPALGAHLFRQISLFLHRFQNF